MFTIWWLTVFVLVWGIRFSVLFLRDGIKRDCGVVQTIESWQEILCLKQERDIMEHAKMKKVTIKAPEPKPEAEKAKRIYRWETKQQALKTMSYSYTDSNAEQLQCYVRPCTPCSMHAVSVVTGHFAYWTLRLRDTSPTGQFPYCLVIGVGEVYIIR